ncbi:MULTISPECIES: Crp/Fnr family transcriptional regulator [Paracoccus]|uniref:Crp/Fnr family transcriptional regulator n=1 Tax=Paracoccus TaxID=265 RepID=UPI000783ECF8|nr:MULTISPECIES: Crp/Fnr family transcriptional regulator [Paracoccus]MCV2446218.1 Crp/Fnr family transcriptional regulator [Paracoccus sp. DMF]MDQ7777562.1 Crp/Fnr family transcriptional regulator [Paracoccus aminovorans]
MKRILDLAELPWFVGLPGEVLAGIEAGSRRRHVARGQLILERGDPGNSVLFVLSGRVLAVQWTPSGREIVYSEIAAGSAFGELSVLSGTPRSLSLYARTACVLLEMPGPLLTGLMETQPLVRQAVIQGLVRRIHDLTERVHELTSLDVEERLRAYLLRVSLEDGGLEPGHRMPDPPTHAEMANMIGANREAVSRVLAKLSRAGIIESGRKYLRILQPDALILDEMGKDG